MSTTRAPEVSNVETQPDAGRDASERTITEVNGVFMGGGARGIAYAGALKAARERGVEFRSVAGASAGAITATLIAAGLEPADIEQAVPIALGRVRAPIPVRLAKAALGHATSVFEAKGLRGWIDETLRAQIGKESAGPVTFAELFAKQQIELYIVTMDLATGQPVVFCRRTTPDVEVAGAVASSSAIPGAFPGGRGVFRSAADGAVVHQLVDGGTWANYPAFIFQDASFRAWLRQIEERTLSGSVADATAWREEGERPVLGFVLGDAEPPTDLHPMGFVPVDGPLISRRFDQGPTYTSKSKPTFLFGSVLSSDWARGILSFAIVVWVALSIAVLPIGVRRFSAWATWLPDWLYPFGLIGTLSVVAVSIVVVMIVVSGLVVVSRLLADTLIPSAQALLGVPTAVAPWVGVGDDAVVVRVPPGRLETINFRPEDTDIEHAVWLAHLRVGEQLDRPDHRRQLGAQWGEVVPPARPDGLRPDVAPEDAAEGWRVQVPSLVVLLVGPMLVGAIAWWVTNAAATSGILRLVMAIVAAFVVVAAVGWFVSANIGALAHGRSITGVVVSERPVGVIGVRVRGLMGVACLVGAIVVSAMAMSDRSAHTEQARVVAASDGPVADAADNDYVMLLDDGRTIEVVAQRHFRLGEQVFVKTDPAQPGQAAIVGAVDNNWFAASVVLWMLGFGFLSSAMRWGSWRRRCRQLGRLLHGWDERSTPPQV